MRAALHRILFAPVCVPRRTNGHGARNASSTPLVPWSRAHDLEPATAKSPVPSAQTLCRSL